MRDSTKTHCITCSICVFVPCACSPTAVIHSDLQQQASLLCNHCCQKHSHTPPHMSTCTSCVHTHLLAASNSLEVILESWGENPAWYSHTIKMGMFLPPAADKQTSVIKGPSLVFSMLSLSFILMGKLKYDNLQYYNQCKSKRNR